MERVKVESSALSAVAYNQVTETLEAVFHPNKVGFASVWHYKPVSQAQYDAFLEDGASVGRVYQALKSTPGIESFKVGEEPAEAAGPA